MARLNADLIRRSPHLLNTKKEHVLDLRGNRIAVIENLEAIEDQIDTIDLSDNEIIKLENFPCMNHLGTLLINNNRITSINHNLGDLLPKMHTLLLTNNRLKTLAEIDPLASLPKLQFLSLLGNTVTKQPDYRLYVIQKLKQLCLLDFKEVEQQERSSAAKKFHSKEAEEEAKTVAAKGYTPVKVVDTQGTMKEHDPIVVAPPSAQIMAIKAEASDGTGNMETDRQDQGNGVEEQKQDEEITPIEEEIMGADSDSVPGTQQHQIELYIYRYLQQTLYTVMSSRRKRPYHGIHIVPTPRRQEPECTV